MPNLATDVSRPGQVHLADLSDNELRQLLTEAANDSKEAAAEDNGEWHAACFAAAAAAYTQELERRHGPAIAETFKETPNG